MQVSRVYIANLVCKWFGHLSLMPNGWLYFVNEEGFTELFCQSSEPGGDQLLFKTPAGMGERALTEGFSSLCLLLHCEPRVAASFIASQREKHPRNPVTYCVQRSPPLKRLRFVPCAVFVCRMSQEIREKAMYTKNIKNNKKIQTQFSCFQPRKLNLCQYCCIFSRDFFPCNYWRFFGAGKI